MTQIKSLRTGIKFKDTPIGKIPVDWEATTIENVCDILDGKRVPLNKEQRDKMKGDIPYYGANGVVDYINDYIFDEDLILLAEDGGYFDEYQTRPIAYLIHGKSWVNNHAHVLKVREHAITEWIFYSLVHKNVIPFIKGGTRSKLNQADLRQIPIQLSPLSEQKRIAEILTTVDDVIEETDRIIEKTKKLKKGLMQKLFTRGIGHKKFKKTEIGEIPVGWEVKKLDEVCNVFGGSTPSTAIKEYWNGEILWATPTDITNLKGRTIEETKQRISEKGLQACAANLLPEGSILMTSRATIGACAINTKPMATNQGFASLVCKEKAYNWFVYYLVLFFRKEIERLGSGSTFKEVSKKSIRSFYIPLPSFSEQKQIADILATSDLEIDNEEVNKQNLETLKKSLMQVLLTGRVRVKLH